MKKIMRLLLVGCLGITIGGCKSNTEDFSNQLTKMNNVIEEDDIFDEDYSVKMSVEILSKNDEKVSMEYTFKVDDDNVYLDLSTVYKEETSNIKIWIEEEEDVYYTYIDDGKSKIYNEYSNENDAFNAFNELGVEINSSLKETYQSLYKELERIVNDCENSSDSNYSCSVEKTLFGKFTLNTKVESLLGRTTESTYVLKKGKILEVNVKSTYDSSITNSTIKIDYGNQKVSLPNKNEYTKK